jgi:hypothetical protein
VSCLLGSTALMQTKRVGLVVAGQRSSNLLTVR